MKGTDGDESEKDSGFSISCVRTVHVQVSALDVHCIFGFCVGFGFGQCSSISDACA